MNKATAISVVEATSVLTLPYNVIMGVTASLKVDSSVTLTLPLSNMSDGQGNSESQLLPDLARYDPLSYRDWATATVSVKAKDVTTLPEIFISKFACMPIRYSVGRRP